MIRSVLLIAFCATPLHAQNPRISTPDSARWNEKGAAAHLDARIGWWMNWSTSQRDHDTFCVSCHTAVPYAMARPALRTTLERHTRTQLEWRLLDNVTKRVRMWKEVEPFYPDSKRGVPKTFESRGTESVLNAIILTSYDARDGTQSRDARIALDNMWAQQITAGADRGAWPWLQFHNAPWEGDSQFYGSTLAAIAIGSAPTARRWRPGATVTRPASLSSPSKRPACRATSRNCGAPSTGSSRIRMRPRGAGSHGHSTSSAICRTKTGRRNGG